jgi:hypothetical protein
MPGTCLERAIYHPQTRLVRGRTRALDAGMQPWAAFYIANGGAIPMNVKDWDVCSYGPSL